MTAILMPQPLKEIPKPKGERIEVTLFGNAFDKIF
jgi:hypothetical protein